MANYSSGAYTDLPTDDTDLTHVFDSGDLANVASDDEVYVTQTAADKAAFEFKNDVGAATSCTVTWEGKSNIAPSASPVYLQIYNRSGTPAWEPLANNDSADANTDFTLTANIADLTNYKEDITNVIACRVYQAASVAPANSPDFTGCSWVQAFYRFESGADLLNDSSPAAGGNGANDVAVGSTGGATVVADTTAGEFWEGTSSGKVESGVIKVYRAMSGLSSGFPFKYGTSNNLVTALGYFTMGASIVDYSQIISLVDADPNSSGGFLCRTAGDGSLRLYVYYGDNTSESVSGFGDLIVLANTSYKFFLRINGTTKAVSAKIGPATDSTTWTYTMATTMTNTPAIPLYNNGGLGIGYNAQFNGATDNLGMLVRLDGWVITNDIVSDGDIAKIFANTYPA